MAHLYAYSDESGKHNEHRVVVFNALVDGFKAWEQFSQSWVQLLRQYELDSFHAKEALRYSQPYGTMKPGTAEERAKEVLPFIRAIIEGLELGVIAAIDIGAYKLPTLHSLRLNISDDPHFFAFYVAISEIMRHWRVPKNYTVGLILDEDEEKALQVFKFLVRMKKVNSEAKKRIPSICFMDDRSSPQVQAADLFTYLCRVEAERKFLGKEHPYALLLDAFNTPVTGKERLEIGGGYYGESQLRKYMESKDKAAKESASHADT
jgi:hypothetical protein